MNMREELAKAKAVNATEAAKPKTTLKGEFFAIVKDAVHMVYSTGSFGYKITYKIIEDGNDAFGREFTENIIVRNKEGASVTLALQKFDRRLTTLGVSSDSSFPSEIGEGLGGLLDFVGKRAVLTLDTEVSKKDGKTYSRIAKVSLKKKGA